MKGYSFPLCIKLVEKLAESKEKFQIQNFQVLKRNTRWDSEGNAFPIFHGLLVSCFFIASSLYHVYMSRILFTTSISHLSWKVRKKLLLICFKYCVWNLDITSLLVMLIHCHSLSTIFYQYFLFEAYRQETNLVVIIILASA